MKAKEPKILIVKSEAPESLAEIYQYEFPCEIVHGFYDTHEALKQNLVQYNVLIIDASDNMPVEGYDFFSELFRKKNSGSLIIGTSIQGENFRSFKNDPLCNRLYDEKVSDMFLVLPENINKMREIIKKRGFKFK
ncbi:MAG: hypothetical protein ABIG37_03450 [Nanoarchaeota archaeon]